MARVTKATSRGGITRKLSEHADSVLLTLDTALGVGGPKGSAFKWRSSCQILAKSDTNLLGAVFPTYHRLLQADIYIYIIYMKSCFTWKVVSEYVKRRYAKDKTMRSRDSSKKWGIRLHLGSSSDAQGAKRDDKTENLLRRESRL